MHELKREPIGFVLIVAVLWIAACSLVPFLASPAASPTIIEITRCKENPTSLCLESFGVDNTDNNMLISFFIPPSSTADFYLKVQFDAGVHTYRCQVAQNFASSVYCAGDRIPLGTSINVGIYSSRENALLAQGTFIVNAIALPTPNIVVPTIETSGTSPFLPTRTEVSTAITSFPARTMTPALPRTVTQTPTPINPYPNPYPNP